MRTSIIFMFLALCLGCHRRKITELKSHDDGWQAYNYPRTTMPPGYVFRIPDGERVPHEVQILKTNKSFDTGFAYLPTQVTNRTINSGVFARFLFLNPNDSTITANYNRNKNISFSIGQGFFESLDEPTIDSLVKNSNIHWRENNTYYIIQQTMSTKRIDYRSTTNGGVNARAILDFETVNASAHFKSDNRDSSVLVQEFDQRYRVYYVVWKITPMGAASSNAKIFTYDKEVNKSIIQD